MRQLTSGRTSHGFNRGVIENNFNELYSIRRLKYVEYSSEPDQSLRYLTGVKKNDTAFCTHWTIDQQDGSTSFWRCVKDDRSDEPGSIVTDNLYGLLYIGEGEAGQRPGWAMVASPGDAIDIRAWGIKCDGDTHPGQKNDLATLIAGARLRGWKLTGGGTLLINATLDLRGVACDFLMMKIQAGTSGLGDYAPFNQQTVQSIATGNPGTFTVPGHGFTQYEDSGDLDEDGNPIQVPVTVDFWTTGTLPNGISGNNFYLVNVTTDTFQLATSDGGAPIAINSTGSGPLWVGKHIASMVVQDVQQWDGSLKRYGIAVRAGAGGLLSARDTLEQKIKVYCDGTFNFSVVSSTIGIRWEDTSGGNTHLTGYGSYAGIMHLVFGQLEKHHCDFHAYYSDWHTYNTTTTNSSDTVEINMYGGVCRHWYWEKDGSDTSILANIVCESRTDPGDGSPAVYLRNGKFTKVSGEIRGNNGMLGILIDKTSSVGTDTVFFDNLTMIHGYGCFVEVRRCRNIAGSMMIKDVDDGPSSGAPDSNPAFKIGRVGSMGGFSCSIFGAKTREALRIGDSANNYYSYDAAFGRWTIHMGLDFQFNTDGTEKSSGFPTAITGLTPSITAVVVEKTKGGHIIFDQCDGLINITSGAVAGDQGKFQAVINRLAKRYTHVNNSSDAEIVEPSYSVLA